METYVIRSIKDRNKLIEYMNHRRLPFKVMFQEIYPKRTLDENAYLFGVVYRAIQDHTGHSLDEIHKAYKLKFNVEYAPDKNGHWALRMKSSTLEDTISIMEFAMKVRADALIEMGINIPLPNECFVNELNFDNEVGYTRTKKNRSEIIPY